MLILVTTMVKVKKDKYLKKLTREVSFPAPKPEHVEHEQANNMYINSIIVIWRQTNSCPDSPPMFYVSKYEEQNSLHLKRRWIAGSLTLGLCRRALTASPVVIMISTKNLRPSKRVCSFFAI